MQPFSEAPANDQVYFSNTNSAKIELMKDAITFDKVEIEQIENEYGITLVSLDEDFRKEMEPNTAPYQERIKALRALHDAGCKTWVSIEPYPTPNFIEQDLNEILEAISFCDKIIFGRLNYNKKVSEYKEHKAYFNELAERVIAYCETNGKQYHIKDGTIT